MSEQGYVCDVCKTPLPSNRARVHCRTCPNYDSCADCHVTESVSGTHSVDHDYEVYIHDRPALIKERSTGVNSNDPGLKWLPPPLPPPSIVKSVDTEPKLRSVPAPDGLPHKVTEEPSEKPPGEAPTGAPSAPATTGTAWQLGHSSSEQPLEQPWKQPSGQPSRQPPGQPSGQPPGQPSEQGLTFLLAGSIPGGPGPSTGLEMAAPEAYWGQLLTPMRTPSPIFSRLIKAIFAHFSTASADALQPGELCALFLASGFSAEEFPPLQVSTNESASPSDLHELDAWLANWIRSFPLDHRMATREFPPPPPIEPVNGRIRMRDQFMHALMYPDPPVVPDGQPLLTPLGLEQYYLHMLLHDPGSLATRLNHLLGALPARLTDPETSRAFETQLIPWSCFPLVQQAMSPETEEQKRMAEKHEMEQYVRDRQAQLQAEYDSAMAIRQGMRLAAGGWWRDPDGVERYHAGL